MKKKKVERDPEESIRPSTPLQEAAANGDVAAVKRLLKEGADVHETGASGLTALWFAVSLNHGGGQASGDSAAKVIRLLMKHKAVVDLNVLSVAMDYNHPERSPEFTALGIARDRSFSRLWQERGGLLVDERPVDVKLKKHVVPVTSTLLLDPHRMESLMSMWHVLRMPKFRDDAGAAVLEGFMQRLLDLCEWNLMCIKLHVDGPPALRASCAATLKMLTRKPIGSKSTRRSGNKVKSSKQKPSEVRARKSKG